MACDGCWGSRRRRLCGDDLPQVVALIGGVCHDDLSGQVFDQGVGLWRITLLAVKLKRTGQPRPRTAIWIFVLRPPRERPSA